MSYCLELTRETGSDLWLQVFCDLQIDEWWDRQESWWWKGVSVKTFLLVPQARCLCLHVKETNNESHFDIYFLLRTSSQHCQDVLPAEARKRLCYEPKLLAYYIMLKGSGVEEKSWAVSNAVREVQQVEVELHIHHRIDHCMEAKICLARRKLKLYRAELKFYLGERKIGMLLSELRHNMPRSKHCRHNSTVKFGSLVLQSCEDCATMSTMMQHRCNWWPQCHKFGHHLF